MTKKSKCTLTNPRQLGVLWEFQYKPRFEAVDKILASKKEAKKRWKNYNLCQKIAIVDRLQAKGYFGEDG